MSDFKVRLIDTSHLWSLLVLELSLFPLIEEPLIAGGDLVELLGAVLNVASGDVLEAVFVDTEVVLREVLAVR